MPRGSYGLQRITSLANATTPGMLSAALWSKISALLGINTVTLPLRLTGSALSIDPATGAAAGSQSAADKAKVDAATPNNVASTLVQRDVNGDIAVRYVNGTLNGNASTATSAGSATTATTATAANALNAGTADGDKLHALVTGASNPANGLGGSWTRHTTVNGGAFWATAFNVALPAALDGIMGTVTTPENRAMGGLVINVSHVCANGQQINTAMRGAAGGTWNGTDTQFQVTARTVDATNLNTKDSTIRIMLSCLLG